VETGIAIGCDMILISHGDQGVGVCASIECLAYDPAANFGANSWVGYLKKQARKHATMAWRHDQATLGSVHM
jgi:hypothetical protein